MAVTSLAEIAVRTTQVWGGLRTRPYSMGGTVPRNDCSSYVATVLGLENPLAWSTVNLPQVLNPISFDQAMPGDVWGKLGPGTSGSAGHVAVITGTPRTRGDTRWEVVEQSGPTGVPGPARNVYKNPPAGYRAYRSKYVTSALPRPPTTVGGDMPGLFKTADSSTLYMSDGFKRKALTGAMWADFKETWGDVPVATVADMAALDAIAGPDWATVVPPGGGLTYEQAVAANLEAIAASSSDIADAVADEHAERLTS